MKSISKCTISIISNSVCYKTNLLENYTISITYDYIRIIKIYINMCNLINVRNKIVLLSHNKIVSQFFTRKQFIETFLNVVK